MRQNEVSLVLVVKEMQQSNKILQIFKISILALFVAATFSSLTGCNTCDSPLGTGSNNFEDRLFFSLYPLNSFTPAIYSINSSGRNFELLAENAILFSAPSRDGRIVFLRFDQTLGKNIIYLKNLLGTADSMLIDQDNNEYNVAQPILSPDGKKIAFNGGRKQLFLWVSKSDGSSYIDKISTELFENTMPAFSPNGDMLAFFESSKVDNLLKFKIISTAAPDLAIVEKSFPDFIKENVQGLDINWNLAGDKASFLLTDEDKNIFEVVGISQEDQQYDLSQFSPVSGAVSPDFNFLIFTDSVGQVWIKYLSDDKYSILFDNDNASQDYYYKWNINGDKIIFNKFFSEDGFGNLSTLILAEIQNINGTVTVKKQIVLGNNAYKGFWGRKLNK